MLAMRGPQRTAWHGTNYDFQISASPPVMRDKPSPEELVWYKVTEMQICAKNLTLNLSVRFAEL